MKALTLFGRFLTEPGMPGDPAAVSREHVEEFIAHLLRRYKPATAANRYRAIGTFFRCAGGCSSSSVRTRRN